MSGPVPRHLRNARRAYDDDGQEIRPMDIANARQNRALGIEAYCPCGHEGVIPLESFPDDAFVPDIGLWLRCSACGRRGVQSRPRWGDPLARPDRAESAHEKRAPTEAGAPRAGVDEC